MWKWAFIAQTKIKKATWKKLLGFEKGANIDTYKYDKHTHILIKKINYKNILIRIYQ